MAMAPLPPWADDHVITLPDDERFPVEDDVEELCPTGLQEALYRTAGDSHLLRRPFLMVTFEVAEAHRFQFIEVDLDELKLREGDP